MDSARNRIEELRKRAIAGDREAATEFRRLCEGSLHRILRRELRRPTSGWLKKQLLVQELNDRKAVRPEVSKGHVVSRLARKITGLLLQGRFPSAGLYAPAMATVLPMRDTVST